MKHYNLNENFLAKEMDEQIVLIDIEDEKDMITIFKDVSVDFWKLINEDMKKNDIIKKITSDYDTDTETVESDFNDFLKSLTDLNILIK